MVGIDKFKEHFKDYEKEYVVIGGTACELLMSKEGLDFRATRDIDMVLIVELLTKEFGEVFWNFIQEANYKHINKGTGQAQFYRFSGPKSSEYPSMIELFSKNQDWQFELKTHIIPIHLDDSISSLSAILLNHSYYQFMREGIMVVDDIPVLKPEYIIPFKAKAYLDLIERKSQGEHVDRRDINKHKNDVFRLSVLLSPEKKMNLPIEIKDDMQDFLNKMESEEVNLKQLGVTGISKENILNLLYQIYAIKQVQEVN